LDCVNEFIGHLFCWNNSFMDNLVVCLIGSVEMISPIESIVQVSDIHFHFNSWGSWVIWRENTLGWSRADISTVCHDEEVPFPFIYGRLGHYGIRHRRNAKVITIIYYVLLLGSQISFGSKDRVRRIVIFWVDEQSVHVELDSDVHLS